MEIPASEDGERCRRTGTPNWRCRERAIPGRSYCQKHYFLSGSRQLRRKSFPLEGKKGISGENLRRRSFPGCERVSDGDSVFGSFSAVEPYRPVIDFDFQVDSSWREPGFVGNDGIALGGVGVGSYLNTLGGGGGGEGSFGSQFTPVWTGGEASLPMIDMKGGIDNVILSELGGVGFKERVERVVNGGVGRNDHIVLSEPRINPEDGVVFGGGNDDVILSKLSGMDIKEVEMRPMREAEPAFNGCVGENDYIALGDPRIDSKEGVIVGGGKDNIVLGDLSAGFKEMVERVAEPAFNGGWKGNYNIALGETGGGIGGLGVQNDFILTSGGGCVLSDENSNKPEILLSEVFEERKIENNAGTKMVEDSDGIDQGKLSEVGSKELVGQGQKRKRGRPKGSKNKNKKMVVENQEQLRYDQIDEQNDGKKFDELGVNFGGNDDIGKRVRQLFESDSEEDDQNRIQGFEEGIDEGLGNEEVPSVREEVIMPKKKRGRPKGVKNKPKMGKNGGVVVSGEGIDDGGCALGSFKGSKRRKKNVIQDFPVEGVGGEVEKMVEKQGRVKGLKLRRKKVIVVAKVEGEGLEKKEERRVRSRGSKNEEEDVVMVAEVGEEEGEKVVKRGRGRPKGSTKKKRKIGRRGRVCEEGAEEVSEAGGEEVQVVRNEPDEPAGCGEGTEQVSEAGGEAVQVVGNEPAGHVGSKVRRRKKKRGRPRGLKNKRVILVDGVLPKVISSLPGGRGLVVHKDMELVDLPRLCGNEKVDGAEMLHESAIKEQKPQIKVSKYQLRARNMPEVAAGSRREQCSRCHQCRSEKNDIIACSFCKKKRYCFPCLKKWYPERTKEEVREACPFCRGNCNCKICLQEKLVMKDRQKDIERKVKLDRLLYLMCKVNPILKCIQEEQRAELEVEARILGKPIKEEDIMKTRFDQDDRIYCDNCNTSIVNFHRSCPNSVCSYDLCISCCQELRSGLKTDDLEAGSSCRSTGGSLNHDISGNSQKHNVDKMGDSEVFTVGNYLPSTGCGSMNINDSILCPQKEHGGCGLHILELRRILELNWVDTVIESIDKVTIDYYLPETDSSEECLICLPTASDSQSTASERRKAASRLNMRDNFLYCPSVSSMNELNIDHFQRHWTRGEPVIVRDVLKEGSGLSWEPMVMWRAFRGANKIMKEDTLNVKAIDCLDWCEVRARLSR